MARQLHFYRLANELRSSMNLPPLNPDRRTTDMEIEEQVSSDLKYIGVVAAFRNIQDAKWKTIKAIPEKCFFCTGPGLWDPVTITIDRLTVKLDLGNEPDEEE